MHKKYNLKNKTSYKYMRVILVRHGESEANKSNIIQGGELDSPLTKLGEKQSKACSEFIHKFFKIKHVWCSPLQRAKSTAKLITNRDIVYHEDLIENKYGIITGKTNNQVYKLPKIGKKIKNIDNQITKLNFLDKRSEEYTKLDDKVMELVNGETSDIFFKRVKKIIRKIKRFSKKETGDLLIVTHSGVIRNMIYQILGHGIIPNEFGKVRNCSISVIDFINNKPKIIVSQYSKYLDRFTKN